MTPEQLRKAGYQERSWSNGVVMECWKPLDGEYTVPHTRRLGVTFGEFKLRPFVVRLVPAPVAALECKGVQTIEQLEALYGLVAGAEGVDDE